jgi:DNA-binding CsgD family transcriptional regulator
LGYRSPAAIGDAGTVTTTARADRVRSQIESLALSGLDTATFAANALDLLARAVPFSTACFTTVDPATQLVTAAYKWGGLTNERDGLWAHLEYEVPDVMHLPELAQRPDNATSMSIETDGDLKRSRRHTDLLDAHFGLDDELRMLFRADGATWGFACLHRLRGSQHYSPAEVEFVGTLSSAFAVGARAGMLAELADEPLLDSVGPAVLVIGPDDEVVQATIGAQDRVTDLGGGPLGDSALPVLLVALVGAAREFAAGRFPTVPRARTRTRSGQWVVAHASPLASRDGHRGDVVVTIEEARPPEIVPLVVAAFGLTAREQDVVALVLQGIDTNEVSRTLHLSAYTVQDHLKSIFAKAGVRSRRELIAKVFYDQYSSRLGGRIAPSGWFAPTTPALTQSSD